VVEKESEHSKIKEALSQSRFIEKLVQMLDRYQGMARVCFRGSPVLERARQSAFEAFLNKDRDEALKNQKASMSEVLAIYTDSVLRKGGLKLAIEAGANEEEYLRQLVQLFTHLVDKDLFIEVYRSYLAKRLLNEKSQSVEQERQMISYIKMQSGPQFTKKLEGMLNDLAIATEQTKQYEAQLSSQGTQDVEFHVTILTSSHWPSYKNFPDLQVPRVLLPPMENFTQYYQGRNNHRLVKWCFSLGTATVSGKFASRTFDLVVGTFQMCVIMQFNQTSEIPLRALKEALKMDDDTLIKNLKSLMLKNFKLLEVRGGHPLSLDAVIGVNDAFTSPYNRIVFPTPVLEEVYKKEVVAEDRSIAVEAAIVRIMKSRRKLGHNELIQEVLTALSNFQPNPAQIKQKIEQLIERDYLERDPDDRTLYRYLA